MRTELLYRVTSFIIISTTKEMSKFMAHCPRYASYEIFVRHILVPAGTLNRTHLLRLRNAEAPRLSILQVIPCKQHHSAWIFQRTHCIAHDFHCRSNINYAVVFFCGPNYFIRRRKRPVTPTVLKKTNKNASEHWRALLSASFDCRFLESTNGTIRQYIYWNVTLKQSFRPLSKIVEKNSFYTTIISQNTKKVNTNAATLGQTQRGSPLPSLSCHSAPSKSHPGASLSSPSFLQLA